MTQVAKAMERLRPWLPLRENASFSGAFDAIYSGAHADVVTLWQDALSRELDEEKKANSQHWLPSPENTDRRFDYFDKKVHELEQEKAQMEAALAREERKTKALSEKVDEWFASAKHWRDKAEQAQERGDNWEERAHEWMKKSEEAKKWPKTTPTGHTYVEPRTYEALCHEHANAAQAAIESWDADECPPEPTWEMVGIAHREVERLQRELKEQKQKPSEFVPHFKLHRDGSVTPQQDDTVLWSTGPRPEPLALAVTERAVEEIKVTHNEGINWRAGETGIPDRWDADAIRELRDGALQEWIEAEALLRAYEVEKRENDPVQKMVAEIQDVLYFDRNDISADEARRVEDLARYLVKKEKP